MTDNTIADRTIRWKLDPANPVIRPGQINGDLDARHAGGAHVLQLGDTYRMYYWAVGGDGVNRICVAESPTDNPNEWTPLGSVLEPQTDTEYNCGGPSFPFVLPREDGPWLMYFGAWGRPREDGTLPNSTGLAVSDDYGRTWRYCGGRPILAMNRPWDKSATGSVWVITDGDALRMYYTAIGEYYDRPEGAVTGHGDVIPMIGIGYAVSTNGIEWTKPFDGLLASPRGWDTDPYEYICSKPCLVAEPGGWRMWVSTFGPAYRVRSLTSPDGLNWTWQPSGPDGDLGVGQSGAFDDHQRSYATVVRRGDEYLCWYTGNAFGAAGMGFAVGEVMV